ncbi:MAG: glycoside hydrolase family 97 protein [Thermoflexibacter sp.]|jgi:alpha-glucosidase|nr:glycoside hydrolase family 97 protein [Thermoflexibacter sp.]
MKLLFFILLLSILSIYEGFGQKSFVLRSPDNRLLVQVNIADKILYSVSLKEQELIRSSPLSLTLDDGTVLGINPKLKKEKQQSINQTIKTLAYKKSMIEDKANELRLDFGSYEVVFRAYNEGFAYQFVTKLKNKIKIKNEEFAIHLNEDALLHASLLNSFWSSYEQFYDKVKISEIPSDKQSYLPLLINLSSGIKIGITESDLYDYPALYLTKNKNVSNSLTGVFPSYPLKEEIGGHNNFGVKVLETAPYMAEVQGTRSFPWRIFFIAEEDKQLLNNDMVYKLARPASQDFSWVKTGKVAWDWWIDNNLYNVPFKSGINMDTYKYFIDFAAANGIEYINLDEGWSDQFDLTKLKNDINVEELVKYGKSKNVGIFLWCVWHVLDRQLAEVMPMFEKWGVKGLKIDFMDRDDQKTMNFYHRIAEECAKRKILVNYHGATKPTGMNRAYPNIINHEGVRGLEYNKFSQEGTTPDHAATIPFVRMLAGYMDYTVGSMYNAQKKDFKTVFSRPMSQGTRCQQLGLYIVLEAPLMMITDSPTEYLKEKECFNFIASLPTIYDYTLPLDGKVGEYAIIARKKDNIWYVGGITNWAGKEITLDFSFLEDGIFKATIFSDGVNADRVGNDYQKSIRAVTKTSKMTIKMAQGGGFAMKIEKM